MNNHNALKHTNISVRIPADHAQLLVDAAKGSRTLISRWAADRLVHAAAAELGVPVPAPAAPTRDRIRAAARAAGMSEDQFRAKALADAIAAAGTPGAVTMTVGEQSVSVPAPVRPKRPSESGEFRAVKPEASTPAALVRQALARVS